MRTFLLRLKGAIAALRGARTGADATDLETAEPSAASTETGRETESPLRRRGLLPRWVPWAAGGVAALIIVVIIVVLVVTDVPRVRVPDLSGSDRATAIKRMKALGLELVVRDTRFSSGVPAGLVVTQVPKAGAIVRQGATILVDLSAGSESFAMPDVVGQTLDKARQALRDHGLDVVFETATSQSPQGTVLSSIPSAGATITTGDTVRLTVAAGVSATDTLLPSDLSALTFVLDPAPAPSGTTATDITFDVARRVRALLEAAGARVIVTRTVTDTAATATSVSRLDKAQETSSSALVGLIVASNGSGGLQVQTMATTSTASAAASANRTLATSLLASLRTNYSTTTTGTLAADTVLQGYGSPAARIRLGSAVSEADKLAFADPAWADNVARDIYRSLASTYGKR